MQTINITTLDQLNAFAKAFALELHGGDVVGLIGDLGAGKTTFVQHLASSLGVTHAVRSPTFTIMQVYPTDVVSQVRGIFQLCHVDAYRLEDEKELRGIGLEEYAGDPTTVTVVEWADKTPSLRNIKGYRELKFALEGDVRKIIF